MNNKDILANAPDGATHWDCSEYMIHVHDGNWNYWSKAAGWNETKPEEETRSLADIKRIVELEAYIQKVQADRIDDIAIERKRWGREDLKALAIRDIEQQASGIEVAVRINLTSYSDPYTVRLMDRATELREQAKALAESKT
tara:strand:+ start:1950 stop:2375 length:426 start_codon:yes stop_codon:yes gene_type:complete